MASIRAELESGEIIELVKDCGCLNEIHQGPHWLHMNDVDREVNAEVGEQLTGYPSISERLRGYAFTQAEMRRLKQLEYEMRSRKIVRIIRPDATDEGTVKSSDL